MEVEVVAVTAIVGVLVCGWLVIDALRDRRAIHERPDDLLLKHITTNRLVAEICRFTVQLMFLVVAIIFSIEDRPEWVGDAGVWILVAIPTVITGWSLWAWWHRKRMLQAALDRVQDKEESDDEF